jgi:hypothetical protein
MSPIVQLKRADAPAAGVGVTMLRTKHHLACDSSRLAQRQPTAERRRAPFGGQLSWNSETGISRLPGASA